MPPTKRRVTENGPRGRTGRFVPCPAGLWRHPEEPKAFEVQWSKSIRKGLERLCFYFVCNSCTPLTRIFLNDWHEDSGYTIPEAEAAGFQPKVTWERRLELLAELGLKPVPGTVPTSQVTGVWPGQSRLPRPPGQAGVRPIKKPRPKSRPQE